MRRDKTQMVIDVLNCIQHNGNRLKLTHIMYKANVNCSVLKAMLVRLVETGFLELKLSGRREFYSITPSGLMALHNYNIASKVFKEVWT